MYRVSRNESRTYSGCPVLNDESAQAYLATGLLPEGVKYLPVPQGRVIRRRGVWLRTTMRAHPTATLFLVATDQVQLSLDPLSDKREAVSCFFSPATGTHFIGRIEDDQLTALVADEFPALNTKDLKYVGPVVAAQ